MKYFFIILTTFISQLTINSQNSFSAKLNIPNEILQGKYTEINLDIYKPEGARNYSVFSQKLPAGFFVKMIDTKGASFLYENNILTLTWLRIPADAKISVKYEISSMVGITGKFDVSGKLTYMAGSKQGLFELKKHTLNVVKEIKDIVNNNNSNCNENNNNIRYTNTSLNGVTCKRTVSYNKKKNYYEVVLFIKKKENGAYTIVEKIPKEFTFSEIESKKAVIRQISDKVQYMWKKFPEGDEIKIKYKLKPKEKIHTTPLVRGKLSFLSNGQILSITITNME